MKYMKKYHTISLPDNLYQELETIVKETGFRTATEYILYILRRSLAEIEKEKEKLNLALSKRANETTIKKIKTRLKRLGYLA